ncbi:class I SAM-dependent methyltransferase [Candidatus Poriferisodalis sp.]|uniref:class I SAM-dependent methyltransferase n=1 Tax=Candidatus Poriferisodalis sp. TaxID=3101277 RepID=UPI003B5918E2
MSIADRWDAIYADASEPRPASEFVTNHAELLVGCPTAIDLAGGTGGTALWLSAQGISTTLVEISERALGIARDAAAERGLQLLTRNADLEAHRLPTARDLGREQGWTAAVCSNFLHRPLLDWLDHLLVPGGLAFVQIATVDNLLINARPGRKYLVKRGELPDLCSGLETVSFEEGWFAGRHEARLVARRPG